MSLENLRQRYSAAKVDVNDAAVNTAQWLIDSREGAPLHANSGTVSAHSGIL